jgi:hypothetical protein
MIEETEPAENPDQVPQGHPAGLFESLKGSHAHAAATRQLFLRDARASRVDSPRPQSRGDIASDFAVAQGFI